jgi:hypothetical protein
MKQRSEVKARWFGGFLPQTRWQRVATWALALVIAGAVGVVAGKAAHNARLLAKWGWQERTVRFAGAPVDRAEVAKYGERVARLELPEGWRAQFKGRVQMTEGPWAKTSYVTGAGSMWGFTLALMNLDTLLLEVPPPGGALSCSVSGCGGSASMGIIKAEGTSEGGAPPEWTEAEQAAWNEWAALVPAGYYSYRGFLIAATVSAGGMGGAEDTTLKVVGVAFAPGMPPAPPTWFGDTSWSLAGTLSVANLRIREQCNEGSVGRYTSPRRWDDRSGGMQWFTDFDPATKTVATLGGMSVEYEVDLDPDPVTGEIDFDAAPMNPAAFYHSISYSGAYAGSGIATNTSFAEVQDVTCSDELVSPNCTTSFYSTATQADEPNDWTPTTTAPTGAVWHYFNSGNTFKLHAVAANGTPTGLNLLTWMRGPLKFNCRVGRGGYESGFDVPAGWRADLGVVRYINEAKDTEPVWFEEGLSEWIVAGYTTKAVDMGSGIFTGGLMFWAVGGSVDEDWLTDNGELCEVEEIDEEAVPLVDNRQVKLLLGALNDPLSGEYWGPAINVVWAEQSADIPPGESERPTLWAAGTGATVDGTDNHKWTITSAGGGTLTRTLASRYDARLGYLATGYEYGDTLYLDDWIIIARANFMLDDDPAEVAAACEVEDVTNYDNSRCLIYTFEVAHPAPANLPDNWQADATLKVYYSTYDLTDYCYTPAAYDGMDLRFGTDGFFEYDKTDSSFTFTGRKLTDDDETTALLFDLGQLPRPNGTDLRHVTGLELTLPQPGEGDKWYFADMRLAEDPDEHDAPEGTYPGFVLQAGTDPWNWRQCGMGIGATFEGVPCWNVPEGTEVSPSLLTEDVQRGIKQTQFLQWNPLWLADQEEPPTYDPTFARNINVRLPQIIARQEQFTGTTVGSAVEAATEDDDGNSLGLMYPWDLRRATADDNSREGGLHVGSIAPYAFLAPTVISAVWTTHGRAHGMAYQGGEFVRGEGVSSDASSAGMAKLYRRAVDDEGEPTGDWEACGSMSPDWTGRWVSPPKVEAGYEYGTVSSGASPNSVSVFVTREYAYLSARMGAVSIAHPFLREGACQRLYVVCSSAGTVHLLHLPYGMAWDDADTTFEASGFAEWPCLAYHRPYLRGALIHGTTAQLLQAWEGDTNDWEASTDLSALDYSYPYADFGLNRGHLYVAGYTGGTHKLAAVDATTGAVQWQKVIAEGADAPGALGISASRRQLVYAVPSGADLTLYWSIDDGDTWTGGGTAAGLAYPSLDCSSEDRFYLAGYAESNAYCERWDYTPNFARRGDRVTVGAADADRVCVARLRQVSQPVIVALVAGAVKAYRSTDDAATWALAETVLI